MLFQSFTFPNGTTAKNRFFKSAMEEQLAIDNQPTQTLVNLYRTWALGGAGVLVTGNVMVSPNGKGLVGDVVVSDDRSLPMLKAWADAGKTAGTLMIMQINHAGKQSPKAVNREPVAPSAVPLVGMDGFINPPRALQAVEIEQIIGEFITTAQIAQKAGFSGVQIHAAHGYLISQFLSPHHNQRNDEWGGSLDNRMRFLIKIYEGIRASVRPDFLVGVKLNSADFQKGGFDENDSLAVVAKLSELGIDFIEISGGNYESPQMLTAKQSTKEREAFFIDYVKKMRKISQVPLIITGGFRSKQAMNEALTSGDLDLVGIARPFALVPDLPKQIQNGTYRTLTTNRIQTGIAFIDKKAGAMLEMNWYMSQMRLIGEGKSPNPDLSAWQVLFKTLWDNGKAGLSTGRS